MFFNRRYLLNYYRRIAEKYCVSKYFCRGGSGGMEFDMLVVKHRIFWSFSVKETETWLKNLSAEGFHIKDINFQNDRFIFEKGEPCEYRYCFSFNKFGHKENERQKKILDKNGWSKIKEHCKWSLYRNNSQNEFSVMPDRRGLFLRNNSLLALYNFISLMFFIIVSAFAFYIFVFNGMKQISDIVPVAMFILFAAVFIALLAGNFLMFVKLTRSNSNLLEEFGSTLNPAYAIYKRTINKYIFENWIERLLIKDGDIVRRFWPFWFLSPDHFEKRLEHMEKRGYNIYKITKSGLIFYFIKGNPKDVKYCIVGIGGESIDEIKVYLEKGWNIIFSTSGQFQKIAILSKVYDGDSDKPMLFEKKEDFLSNSGRISVKTAMMYIDFFLISLIVALFFYLFYVRFIFVLAAVSAAFCLVQLVRIAFYRRRAKKAADEAYA